MDKILIVEDDNDINALLKELLVKEYDVRQAFAGSEGKLLFDNDNFDLIILDLMLPGISGEELISYFKSKSNAPIIVITAKADVSVLVDVLSLGADDYIAKPFNNQEVLARLKMQLKRNNVEYSNKVLSIGNITLDDSRHEVRANNKLLVLTQKEYEILKLLLSNPKRVYTKSSLYELIWDDTYYGDDNTISVHMSRLRNKLKNDYQEDIIETVWGVGFKLKGN